MWRCTPTGISTNIKSVIFRTIWMSVIKNQEQIFCAASRSGSMNHCVWRSQVWVCLYTKVSLIFMSPDKNIVGKRVLYLVKFYYPLLCTHQKTLLYMSTQKKTNI